MTKRIPIYDICTIDRSDHPDLLIDRFAHYLEKHYANLSRPHRHTFYHLVLFTEGKGYHTIDFSRFTVKPYQVYFMSPGQVHSWHFEGKVDGYIIHFGPEFFGTFLQSANYILQFNFFNGNSEDGVYNIPLNIQPQIIKLFESLLEEKQGSKNLDLIRILMLELFIRIDRSCINKKNKNISQQKLLTLHHFKQLIEKHYRLIRLPKEYAELMYITPNHLNALCQDIAGRSAGELIRDRIILEAKILLTNADMGITEIAYDLNFQDNSYFTRFFRKHTGLTPEQFRKGLTH